MSLNSYYEDDDNDDDDGEMMGFTCVTNAIDFNRTPVVEDAAQW